MNSHHLPAAAKVSLLAQHGLGPVKSNQVVSTVDVSICIQNTRFSTYTTAKISSYLMVCTKSCVQLMFNILPEINTLMPLCLYPVNWPLWQQ